MNSICKQLEVSVAVFCRVRLWAFHLANLAVPMPLFYPSAQEVISIAAHHQAQPGIEMSLSGVSASALHILSLSLPNGSNYGSLPHDVHWLPVDTSPPRY